MEIEDYLAQNSPKNYESSVIGGIPENRRYVSKKYFEEAAGSIASLGRNELKRRIQNFRGKFKLDFTDDCLDKLGVDRLRHILLAALINARE